MPNEQFSIFDPIVIASRGLITTGFHLPYDPKLRVRSNVAAQHDTC